MRQIKEIKKELSWIRTRIKNLEALLETASESEKKEVRELKGKLVAIIMFSNWMFRSKNGGFAAY
jgi:hypothetical protein